MLFLRFFWWIRLGTIQSLGLLPSGTRSMPSSRFSHTLLVGEADWFGAGTGWLAFLVDVPDAKGAASFRGLAPGVHTWC